MSVPGYWRESKYRYRLIGTRCPRCGAIHFPRRLICRCGSRELEEYKLSEKGKLLSYTVIRDTPPRGYEFQVPYIIGLVELEDGVKILTQIVDAFPEEIQVGMPVEMVFRKVREAGVEGIIEYGYKFRPRMAK
ncbi:TPA: Zn-ribbon domain-containing OB-fold protein [Candidatus Bipolaricaulota bacterium]|nr:Zn-ribbon domain-containing OB-fold protein [Candidatus Bipolaricaulota bacterium]